MNKIWKETGLEFARVIVLSVLPVLLAGIDQSTGMITINWRVVLAVALVALLRAVDKYIHQTGKYFEDSSLERGLTRF